MKVKVMRSNPGYLLNSSLYKVALKTKTLSIAPSSAHG